MLFALPDSPAWLLPLAAVGIPWMEALAVLSLATGVLRRGAALVSGPQSWSS